MKFRACSGFLSLFLTSVTWSVQGAGFETNTLSSPASSSGDLLFVMLRLIGALFLVIAVFLGGVWFFKRTRLFALYQGAPAQLKILESKAVGYRNTLLVVGYYHHRFLLAVSASGVNLVSPLPDAPSSEVASSGHPNFAEQLGVAQERKA